MNVSLGGDSFASIKEQESMRDLWRESLAFISPWQPEGMLDC